MEEKEKEMLDKMQEMEETGILNLDLTMPITVVPSTKGKDGKDLYLLIIKDAKGICHYFMPDGNYDGYVRPAECT